MSYYRGEKVYDPRTGRYLGKAMGPYGSAFTRIVPANSHKVEVVKNEKISR